MHPSIPGIASAARAARAGLLAWWTLACAAPALADPPPESDTGLLEHVLDALFGDIERLSGYRRPAALPAIYIVPQHVIEAKVCEEPCDVTAAYLPREGVYLSAHLDVENDAVGRAALLHELVHYLQQGHPGFADLHGCARERAKEAEAYAIQNAYLAGTGRPERAVFYTGEFDDCPAAPDARQE
jgi:hypothetical protein